MKRREFLQKAALGGGVFAGSALAGLAMPTFADEFYGSGGGIDIEEGLYLLEGGKGKNKMPEIRPEIRNNPRAVFLIETHVGVPRDERGFFTEARPELEEIGNKAVRDIFVPGSDTGGSTLIKPNFTTVPDHVLSPVVGINTSCDFVAGFVGGLRDIGNTNVIVSDRGTTVVNHRKTGIYSVFDRHGINMIEANYRQFEHYSKQELNWHRVPKPVVWKRIPTYRPIGDRDNLFINMAKLKCHNLGLTTLTVKNLQGTVPHGYGQYCLSWAALPALAQRTYRINYKRDFVQDYQERIEQSFLRHRRAGYKYWDYENYYPEYEKRGGWDTFKKIRKNPAEVNEFMKGIERLMWDEQWCQRALDSATAITPSINIIEGVIGRDGSGFDTGRDELTNVVIAGLSVFEVDAVGSYIMGHNPKELYYTRIAKERGLGENDPEKIQMYWIRGDSIVPVKNPEELRRFRLGVNLHTWTDTGTRLIW